jgi:hypothetical protein
MQFADRTFRFNVVEGDEELGNYGPDIKIGSLGGYLPDQRRAVVVQCRWKFRLLVPCTCESEKPVCQVVTRTCKLDKEGWSGAGESVKEVAEIVLDIYPY